MWKSDRDKGQGAKRSGERQREWKEWKKKECM